MWTIYLTTSSLEDFIYKINGQNTNISHHKKPLCSALYHRTSISAELTDLKPNVLHVLTNR